MKKTVRFFSFGHHYHRLYPKRPAENTYQIVFDLRMLYEPYRDGYEDSGLEGDIKKLVIRQNKKFFTAMKPVLRELIDRFHHNSQYHTLDIFFGCVGGWQRSVAAAEYFKDWTLENLPGLSVTVRHLRIEKEKI